MIIIGKYSIPESSIGYVNTQNVRTDKDTNHFGVVEERQVETVRIHLLVSTGKEMAYLDIDQGQPEYEAAKSYFSQGSNVVDLYQAQETKATTKKKATPAEDAAA